MSAEFVRAYERRFNTLCVAALLKRAAAGEGSRWAAGEVDDFGEQEADFEMFDAAAQQAVEELVGIGRN